MAIVDPDQEMKERMPKVTQGQTFYAVAAEKTEHFTSPPKPYSEDTLLAAMETAGNKEFDEDTEKKGLGTPATRAGIIEKLIYSQYRELASFAQFGSDLDADTKARLEQGVRIVEVLKQNQNAPVPVEKQVAILYAVTKGVLESVKVEDVNVYESGLYTYLDTDAAGVEVMQEIRSTGKLEQETEQKLRSVLDTYTENFLNTRPEK